MPTVRIALYAEGSRERSGPETLLPAPGMRLREEQLGAAHILVRRIAVEAGEYSTDEVLFASPLRLGRRGGGMLPTGSQLLDRRNLQQLLSWPMPRRRPDLGVVLVDADGDNQRLKTLGAYVEELTLPTVVGVSKEEFEAWLLSDHPSLQAAIGRSVNQSPNPESLPPGEAKNRYFQIVANSLPGRTANEMRMDIVRNCDLDRWSATCTYFERFRKDILAALRAVC